MNRIKSIAKFLSQIVLTIAGIVFFTILSLMGIMKNFCQDWSLCFSIIIFLIGIHITLKIRILDSDEEYKPLIKKLYFGKEILKKNELIAFLISIFFNVLFLALIFISISHSKIDNDSTTTVLNTVICIDFVIVLRNLTILYRLYWPRIFPNNKDGRKEEMNTEIDLFANWLNKKDNNELIKRALTDKSYRKYAQFKKYEDADRMNNSELATYGDSIIKFCYSDILLDNGPGQYKNITEAKKNYESDEVFVTKVAKHYKLLEYMDYDKDDSKKPQNYDYAECKSKNNNPHKYIATAVEAMVGAIYKETGDLNGIIELMKTWMKFDN